MAYHNLAIEEGFTQNYNKSLELYYKAYITVKNNLGDKDNLTK